jgi:hypothetical protein
MVPAREQRIGIQLLPAIQQQLGEYGRQVTSVRLKIQTQQR